MSSSEHPERNEWREAMLDLLDRLGTESWPLKDSSPREVSDAIFHHVRDMEKRERACEAHKIVEVMLGHLVDSHGDYVPENDLGLLRRAGFDPVLTALPEPEKPSQPDS
jgi:hypothetical protein